MRLTPGQEKRRKSIEHRLRSAMRDATTLACEVSDDPKAWIYIECEGLWWALPSEEGGYRPEDRAGRRQDQALFTLNVSQGEDTRWDCGAW